ncbi:hypothetical protein H7X46_28065 [Pseudonocardia sp. C8]|uniref:hypothetical protein n=1 Tax=Pseudonocardia sp. C8 TaxID=2762759 RepID=UPI00164299C2|nr:hypothetical protein [Pseudonocardia sp. C8]MBC3194914.1 hypothetical protein [Pseudonocardia sp. C8]
MEPDCWQHYELAAVIGARRRIDRLTWALEPDGPAIPVLDLDAADLCLVPVLQRSAGVPDRPGNPGGGPGDEAAPAHRSRTMLLGPESGFTRLTRCLLDFIELASADGSVAYAEAEYSESRGRQAAAVWTGGGLVTGPLLLGPHEVFHPSSAPISVALRALGVRGDPRYDPFLVVGLHRHRRTSDWLDVRTDNGA